MTRIFEPVQKKIKQIQRADPKIKKRWLFGLSGFSMIIVLVLWLGYLNLSLPKITSSESEKEIKKGESFFSVLGRGFLIIGANVKNQISQIKKETGKAADLLKSQLQKANEFSVESKKDSVIIIKNKATSSEPAP